MEADPSALVDDFLSPPFLCWLARDGLWTHPGLIPVWGGRWTLLPWSARAVFLLAASAGVLVAGSLLYCRLLRGRRGGSDAEKECYPPHKLRQRNTQPPRDQGGSNHHDYYSPPPLSPLTPRVTIFPSHYLRPPPPTSPPYTSPFIEGTDEVESERAVISFLDSDDEEGEHETTPITETTPLAPPTTTGNQATVEFSLSYTGGSDQSDEEEGRVGHQEEIVSPTIVTVL